MPLTPAKGFCAPPFIAWLDRLPRRSRALHRLLGPDWPVAYAFLAPTLLLMGGLIAYPFLRAVMLSFTHTRGSGVGPFVGLRNYRFLWRDRFFREAVWTTVRLTLFSGVLKFAIAMVAALVLHRLGARADVWAGLLLLPWIMPTVVRAIAWRGLLDPLYGLVNRILLDLGLLRRAVPFFGTLHLALPSVILVDVWQGIPFFTINLLAGFKSVSEELYEAASIDGAGAWRRFLHVTLPGLRHVIIVVNLLATIWTFNSFELIFLLTGGGPMNATKVYSVLAYDYAVRGRQFGLATAVALSVAPVFVLAMAILARVMLGSARPAPQVPANATRLVALLSRGLSRLKQGLSDVFWWANDSVERLFESVASLFRRWLPYGSRRRSRRIETVAASVVVALLLLFELGPFYWVLITAFKSELQITLWRSVLWPQPWTLDQFRSLLGPQQSLLLWLRNTVLIATVSPLIATGCAALSAYALVRLRWRGAALLANSVLITYLMPGVLLVIPIYQLFIRLGITNTLFSLIIAYPTLTLPFAIWLTMGYYASIPQELEAAAMVDGCGPFKTFWHIVLPLGKPALIAATLFGVTQAWNEYLYAATFIASEGRMTISLGLAQMIWGDVAPWGRLCAAAVIMSVPVLALYILGQRFMVAGLTAGAIKGRS